MSDTQTPIHELAIVTDAHMASPLWVAVSNVLIGTTPERALYDTIVNPVTVILSSELLPSTGWTSTGWTGNLVDGYTHTTGNTSALSNTIAAIIDKIYQLSVTISGRTAGSVDLAFGGGTADTIILSDTEVIVASTNGNLVITPTTDFDGKIVLSLKQQTWQLPTAVEILNILGKADVVQSSQLSAYALVVSDKSLVLDTEITKLGLLIPPKTITLPAGANLTTKLADAIETTDYPTDWVLTAVGDEGKNLQIVHTLTGREIASITVKVTDDSGKRGLVPFRDAYSGWLENDETLIIEGLAPNDLPITIILMFK